MEYVSLNRDPNQSFSLAIGGYVLVFTLRLFRGVTYCTITSSDEGRIVTSRPVVNKGWLLPIRYEQKYGVNYRFKDDNGDYPSYEKFDGDCVLCAYTREEAEKIRAEVS